MILKTRVLDLILTYLILLILYIPINQNLVELEQIKQQLF